MSTSTTEKFDFFPIASIIAFVFIGVIVLVGLVARCLAVNNSTIRSAQSLDLALYQAAPKPAAVAKVKYSSTFDSNNDNRGQAPSMEDPVKPTRIHRGPKNM